MSNGYVQPQGYPAQPPTHNPHPGAPVCQTCRNGYLAKKRVNRMSGPVVVIGYLLLIPSILGVLASILFGVFGLGAAGSTAASSTDEIRRQLEVAQVPPDVISTVMAGGHPAPDVMQGLTPEQQANVSSAQGQLAGSAVGAGCCGMFAGGGAICGAITFFISGLLGWLLVMKKDVLQCGTCNATIAAS